jgi:hypothetical protein
MEQQEGRSKEQTVSDRADIPLLLMRYKISANINIVFQSVSINSGWLEAA